MKEMQLTCCWKASGRVNWLLWESIKPLVLFYFSHVTRSRRSLRLDWDDERREVRRLRGIWRSEHRDASLYTCVSRLWVRGPRVSATYLRRSLSLLFYSSTHRATLSFFSSLFTKILHPFAHTRDTGSRHSILFRCTVNTKNILFFV